MLSKDLILTNRNVLDPRFNGLSIKLVERTPTPGAWNIAQIGFSFITAMSVQARQNCNQQLHIYSYNEREFPGPNPEPLYINMATRSSFGVQSPDFVRCNVLWTMKSLPMILFYTKKLYGLHFQLLRNGNVIYDGTVSGEGGPVLSGNQSENSGQVATQKRQPLDSQSSLTTLLTIPGSDNAVYQIRINFQGEVISQSGYFGTILTYLLELGQSDADTGISSQKFTSAEMPNLGLWVYAWENLDKQVTLRFRNSDLIGALQAIVSKSVGEADYRESTWQLFGDGNMLAVGCITAPTTSKVWCDNMNGAVPAPVAT